jgi:hypothetical protein
MSPRPARKNATNKHPRRFRPLLEALEDRLAPALLTVNTLQDETDHTDAVLSLREAIAVVNSQSAGGLSAAEQQQITGTLGGDDTIQFDPGLGGGTITLGGTELAVTQPVSITGPAAGLTLDANHASRVFNVNDGTAASIAVAISGLTLANGSSPDYGGAIYNAEALTLAGCTLSGNSATFGGGDLYNYAGTATLSNCTVSGGSAYYYGGGIGNYAGTLTLAGCTLSGNSGGGLYNFGGATASLTGCTLSGNSGSGIVNVSGATASLTGCTLSGNSDVDGGALYNQAATASLTGCTLSGNSATSRNASNNGGAIYNDDGTLTVTSCTLSGNSATNGGALYNADSGISNPATATLTGCTLSGNSAGSPSVGGSGGAVENDYPCTATLINCTLSGNSAGSLGGGVYNYWMATLTNCTLWGNSAHFGEACGGGLYAGYGTSTLNNSIVANSTAGRDVTINVGASTAGSHNLIDDGSGALADTITADPQLGPLQDNGGPTQTMALLPGSPAIDGGSNALAVDAQGNPLSTDQRGTGFNRVVNGTVDIGAFEVQQAPVTHLGVSAPTSVTAGSAFSVTVTALDDANHTVTGYTGTVHFTSTDTRSGVVLPSDYTFTAADNGTHTFTNAVTLVTAGSPVVRATDAASLSGSAYVAVAPAAPTQLVLHTPPSPTATAGVAFATQPVLYVEDAFGNLETGDNATQVTVALHTGTDVLHGTATVTASGGVATFTNLSYNKAEAISLDFTSGSLTRATSGTITVSAAAASTFGVTGFPTSVTAGVAGSFTVTAYDAYGNVATGYRGKVHFSSSDKKAVLPADYTFTASDNGVHVFTVTLKTAGQQTITVTDTVNAITASVLVNKKK